MVAQVPPMTTSIDLSLSAHVTQPLSVPFSTVILLTPGPYFLSDGADIDSFILLPGFNTTIYALGGDDTIYAYGGVATIYGGTGSDYLYATGAGAYLDGGDGNDWLSATGGQATLSGGNGNDWLTASNTADGINALDGGAGDDTLYVSGVGTAILTGGDGNDLMYSGDDGSTTLFFGGAGNDEIVARSGPAWIDGGDGLDTVAYDLSQTGVYLNLVDQQQNAGGAAGEFLVSIEQYFLSNFGDTFIDSNAAATLYVYGGRGSDYLQSGSGDDWLDGGSGNDSLYGGDGNDILFGGNAFIGQGVSESGGDDLLYGGNGDDSLIAGDGNDFLDGGAGADFMRGDDGFDTVSYSDATAGVRIDLTRASSTWTGDARGDVFSGIERISLTNFADLFIGDANANQGIFGGNGDDRLIGMGGDDGLTGGNGNDLLEGGDGNDVLRGDGFAGSPGNDFLFGNAGDDILGGDAGNDALWGGSGADALDGGDGYDTAEYGDATSGVSIDLMAASSTWTGDARGDTLTSIEAFDLTAFNDVFSGGDGNETVISRAGNDQLFGRGGSDRLVAGEGNDILSGGLGADVLQGDQGADIFKYSSVEESSGAVVNGVQQIDDITDFTQGQDKIDLSAIDANGTLTGNQAFTFLDNPASHTGAWTGFVWTVNDGNGHTIILASTDADADPEMQIYLPQVIQLHASDFVL
jgi:Ca2+-binding RTX toxin-like protein